ncbi:zinc ribbon domain-containing protein [Mycobacterium sp.]|jgi:predicted  nucleic acid-binding Zn-ribbon protein|uniref:zinc ribbon domain-containing protein n=1 Tax=Mycobacterium sp. TaxID=1785 RepID=UPI002D69844B|nr:zinc ribbon domain-containing protein [Mycobacterium sp.]HZA08501.1 zinc ribbon domain-containing protein [Mycobacterium sp.]
MKAEISQQRSLAELAGLDAELIRIAHRESHLPEQQRYEQVQADHRAANDRLAALRLALDDLDAHISRFESEIDAVRQREDRDRSLLETGSPDARQLTELQHELDTLQRRQSSLEDSLLEVMERREELQSEQARELSMIDGLQTELAGAQQARDAAMAEIEQTRGTRAERRAELIAGLDPELVRIYERQRTTGGVGAGPLQGRRCGACRMELDRGELARISAAAEDDVLRCPECGAILLRVKGSDS